MRPLELEAPRKGVDMSFLLAVERDLEELGRMSSARGMCRNHEVLVRLTPPLQRQIRRHFQRLLRPQDKVRT